MPRNPNTISGADRKLKLAPLKLLLKEHNAAAKDAASLNKQHLKSAAKAATKAAKLSKKIAKVTEMIEKIKAIPSAPKGPKPKKVKMIVLKNQSPRKARKPRTVTPTKQVEVTPLIPNTQVTPAQEEMQPAA
jgi:hypothetical protein